MPFFKKSKRMMLIAIFALFIILNEIFNLIPGSFDLNIYDTYLVITFDVVVYIILCSLIIFLALNTAKK